MAVGRRKGEDHGYSDWSVRAGSIAVARRAGSSVAPRLIAASTSAATTNVSGSVALVAYSSELSQRVVTIGLSETVSPSGLVSARLKRGQLTKQAQSFVDFCRERLAQIVAETAR